MSLVQTSDGGVVLRDEIPDGPAITLLRKGGGPKRSPAIGPWRLISESSRARSSRMAAGAVIVLLYLVGIIRRVPGALDCRTLSRPQYTFAPPQSLGLFVTPAGRQHDSVRPHVKGYRIEVDEVALRRTFVVDEPRIVPVGFFVEGAQYKLWGLFPHGDAT